MPPTPPTEFAMTLALPRPIAEFAPDVLLKISQFGISMAALPLKVTPVADEVSSALMHGSPPAGMLAVVAGAVERKNELNGSLCCSAIVTVTLFVSTPESAGKAITQRPPLLVQFEWPVVSP